MSPDTYNIFRENIEYLRGVICKTLRVRYERLFHKEVWLDSEADVLWLEHEIANICEVQGKDPQILARTCEYYKLLCKATWKYLMLDSMQTTSFTIQAPPRTWHERLLGEDFC